MGVITPLVHAGPQEAEQNPTPHGEVNISRSDGQTTIVDQDSQDAIINWQQFDIGVDESVDFQQPGAKARALNRVIQDNPSEIRGNLTADGQIYLVNPAGIMFGPDATVHTAKLYAAAGHMSNEDFLAGKDLFTDLEGTVENVGDLEGTGVHLLGKRVKNFGTIDVADGVVTMSSGDDVLLGTRTGHVFTRIKDAGQTTGKDGAAVKNEGTVDAGDGSVKMSAGDMFATSIFNDGGTVKADDIELAGGDGKTLASGRIDASTHEPGEQGGSIEIVGSNVALFDGAEVTADGPAGGGEINIGGSKKGEGPLPNAENTFVGSTVTIASDATHDGDGGKVIVWSDGSTQSYADLTATGGPDGGDGGFAEVSGKTLDTSISLVDVSARQGEDGMALFDPNTITIEGGSADGDDEDIAADPALEFEDTTNGDENELFFTDGPSTYTIFESEIENDSSGGAITLRATEAINTTGTFASGLVLPSGIDLILKTDNDGLTGGIDLAAANSSLNVETQGTGSITVVGSTSGNSAGNITVPSLTTADEQVTLETHNGSISILGGISAGTGDVSLDATAGISQQPAASITAGGLELLGTGSVTLNSSGNNIGSLAGRITGPGKNVSVTDTAGVTIGTVQGTSGLTTSDGDVTMNTGGDLTLGDDTAGEELDAGSGNVVLDSAGDIDGGSNNGAAELIGNRVELDADSDGIGLTTDVELAADHLDADTTAGDGAGISIDSTGDVTVGLVRTGQGTGQNVTLNASGHIRHDGDAADDVVGDTVTLTAGAGGVGTQSSPVDVNVQTAFNADTAADDGGVFVDSPNNDLLVDAVDARGTGTSGDVVLRSSSETVYASSADSGVEVDATNLGISAGDGIGDNNTITNEETEVLDTRVDTFNARETSGKSIEIDNTGDLELTNAVLGLNTSNAISDTGGGSTLVTAASDVTVSSPVDVTGDFYTSVTGDVIIKASVTADDNVGMRADADGSADIGQGRIVHNRGLIRSDDDTDGDGGVLLAGHDIRLDATGNAPDVLAEGTFGSETPPENNVGVAVLAQENLRVNNQITSDAGSSGHVVLQSDADLSDADAGGATDVTTWPDPLNDDPSTVASDDGYGEGADQTGGITFNTSGSGGDARVEASGAISMVAGDDVRVVESGMTFDAGEALDRTGNNDDLHRAAGVAAIAAGSVDLTPNNGNVAIEVNEPAVFEAGRDFSGFSNVDREDFAVTSSTQDSGATLDLSGVNLSGGALEIDQSPSVTLGGTYSVPWIHVESTAGSITINSGTILETDSSDTLSHPEHMTTPFGILLDAAADVVINDSGTVFDTNQDDLNASHDIGIGAGDEVIVDGGLGTDTNSGTNKTSDNLVGAVNIEVGDTSNNELDNTPASFIQNGGELESSTAIDVDTGGSAGISLGSTVDANGTLDLDTGTSGPIKQTGGTITASGDTTLTAGTGNDITLDRADNDFDDGNNDNDVTIESGNNITIDDKNAVDVAGPSGSEADINGSLTLNTGGSVDIETNEIDVAGPVDINTLASGTSGGAIKDGSSGFLVVSGITTLDAGKANNIQLDHNSNDFDSAGSGNVVKVTSANQVTLHDNDSIVLASVDAEDTLTVNAARNSSGTTGSITNVANATIEVANNATFNTDGQGGEIALGNKSGDVMNFGTLTFDSTGADTDSSVTIIEDDATVLRRTSQTKRLSLTSGGSITDTTETGVPDPEIEVTNNATFDNSGTGSDITLGDTGSDTANFGTLTFTSDGTVSITENSNMLLTNGSVADVANLTSTSNIDSNNNNDTADVDAEEVNLTAGTSGSGGIGTSARPELIDSDGSSPLLTLSADTSHTSTPVENINIDTLSDTELTQVTTGSNTAGTIILSSTGTIQDGGDTNDEFQAGAVGMEATGGIGNSDAIDTDIGASGTNGSLNAINTGSGAVRVDNSGDLEQVNTVLPSSPTNSVNTPGNVEITTASDLIISSPVSGTNVYETASEDLIVEADVIATDGNIGLRADADGASQAMNDPEELVHNSGQIEADGGGVLLAGENVMLDGTGNDPDVTAEGTITGLTPPGTGFGVAALAEDDLDVNSDVSTTGGTGGKTVVLQADADLTDVASWPDPLDDSDGATPDGTGKLEFNDATSDASVFADGAISMNAGGAIEVLNGDSLTFDADGTVNRQAENLHGEVGFAALAVGSIDLNPGTGNIVTMNTVDALDAGDVFIEAGRDFSAVDSSDAGSTRAAGPSGTTSTDLANTDVDAGGAAEIIQSGAITLDDVSADWIHAEATEANTADANNDNGNVILVSDADLQAEENDPSTTGTHLGATIELDATNDLTVNSGADLDADRGNNGVSATNGVIALGAGNLMDLNGGIGTDSDGSENQAWTIALGDKNNARLTTPADIDMEGDVATAMDDISAEANSSGPSDGISINNYRIESQNGIVALDADANDTSTTDIGDFSLTGDSRLIADANDSATGQSLVINGEDVTLDAATSTTPFDNPELEAGGLIDVDSDTGIAIGSTSETDLSTVSGNIELAAAGGPVAQNDGVILSGSTVDIDVTDPGTTGFDQEADTGDSSFGSTDDAIQGTRVTVDSDSGITIASNSTNDAIESTDTGIALTATGGNITHTGTGDIEARGGGNIDITAIADSFSQDVTFTDDAVVETTSGDAHIRIDANNLVDQSSPDHEISAQGNVEIGQASDPTDVTTVEQSGLIEADSNDANEHDVLIDASGDIIQDNAASVIRSGSALMSGTGGVRLTSSGGTVTLQEIQANGDHQIGARGSLPFDDLAITVKGASITMADSDDDVTSSGTGDVELYADAGSVEVGDVEASGNRVFIESDTDEVVDVASDAGSPETDVTAMDLGIKANSGIGDTNGTPDEDEVLETTVSRLNAHNTSGNDIEIVNTGDLELMDLDPAVDSIITGDEAVANDAGDVRIEAASNQTVTGPASGSNVYLTATEDLIVEADVTATSGNVGLRADADDTSQSPDSEDLQHNTGQIEANGGGVLLAGENITVDSATDPAVTADDNVTSTLTPPDADAGVVAFAEDDLVVNGVLETTGSAANVILQADADLSGIADGPGTSWPDPLDDNVGAAPDEDGAVTFNAAGSATRAAIDADGAVSINAAETVTVDASGMTIEASGTLSRGVLHDASGVAVLSSGGVDFDPSTGTVDVDTTGAAGDVLVNGNYDFSGLTTADQGVTDTAPGDIAGGRVRIDGTVTTSGAAAPTDGGDVTLATDAPASDVWITGLIDASGADDATGRDGGTVTAGADLGDVQVDDVFTSGGDATGTDRDGGAAGDIDLQPDDGTTTTAGEYAAPDGLVTLTGDLHADGGAPTGAGVGGDAGTIELSSDPRGVNAVGVASIVGSDTAGRLNITANGASDTGRIEIGEDEKLTSPGATGTTGDGDLLLAATGQVEMGDVVVDGRLDVRGGGSGDVVFHTRNSDELLPSDGSVVTDQGMDVVARGAIRFDGVDQLTPVDVSGAGEGDPQFASLTPGHISPRILNNYVIRSLETFPGLTRGTTVLDARSTGPLFGLGNTLREALASRQRLPGVPSYIRPEGLPEGVHAMGMPRPIEDDTAGRDTDAPARPFDLTNMYDEYPGNRSWRMQLIKPWDLFRNAVENQDLKEAVRKMR